jgi:phage baseplate assembly protein W
MSTPMVGTPGAIRQPPPTAGSLGQGVAYPISYTTQGRLKLAYGIPLVEQALQTIWETSQTERAMLPQFGAAQAEFEPIDLQLHIARLKKNVKDYEPRVDSISVDTSPGQTEQSVQVIVTYYLAGDDNENTLTFPEFQGP